MNPATHARGEWSKEYLILGVMVVCFLISALVYKSVTSAEKSHNPHEVIQNALSSVGIVVTDIEPTQLDGIFRAAIQEGNIYHVAEGGAYFFTGPLVRVEELARPAAAPKVDVMPERFVAGKDYHYLPGAQGAPSKIEKPIQVIEYFSYACVHCYDIEKFLSEWLEEQGNTVKFTRIPVVFSSGWDSLARAFYISQELGISAKVHEKLFDAVHREKIPLNEKQQLGLQFGAWADVAPADVEEAFVSSKVIKSVREGVDKALRLKVTSVPTITIAETYVVYVVDQRSFTVMDYLIEKTLGTENHGF